jgi:A/G-specific adenine glycosylase
MTFPDACQLLAPLGPWFDQGKRALPWRCPDLDRPHPDPYAVLVSEAMLQQTQVATVIPYFQRWLARLPDLAALAAASEDEIHGLWAGLGYYRRARSLQAAAKAIVLHGWPGDLEGLQALPGLGPYTAAAVAAQAFQWPTPALDGNAFRVLARLLALEDDPKRQAPALRAWLTPALAAHGPSRLTQAVMELGATLCAPAPKCGACPLQEVCAARLQGSQARIPPVQPRAQVREAQLRLLAIQSPLGWLLRPPGTRGLLAGLWSWPTVAQVTSEGAAGLEGAASPSTPYGVGGEVLKGWVQVYTHRRETIRPLVAQVQASPAPAGTVWVEAEKVAGLPMGRRDQRLREARACGKGTPLEAEDLACLMNLLGYK